MEDSRQSEDAKTFEHLSKLRNEAQNANSNMMQRREEDEVQSPPPPVAVDEDPAVEGLLLLQHSSQKSGLSSAAHPDEKTEDSSGILKISAVSLKEGTASEESNSNRTDFEDKLNPLKKLVLDGIKGLELCVQNAFLEHYRGVFLHEELSMYYALLSYNGSFHFLGFHSSAASAARAWDLAALKRSIDNGKNLSMARTNFSFDRYMQLENVLGILVVLTFSGLVELLKSFTLGGSTQQISSESLGKVNQQIQICNEAFINEEGNVSIPSELREVILNSAKTSSKIQTFTPDQLSTILTKSCPEEAISQDNEWVKTIRNNHSWKGVYFTREGCPYSKVEMEGEFKYLGKFETVEAAARAYDLATLKRAMMNNQSLVSLNFSTEDYIKHEQLMSFLYFADTEQVTGFIIKMTQGNKAKNYTSSISGEMADFDPELKANKRKKLETSEPMACLASWGLTPTSADVQHIDWSSLNFRSTSVPPETPAPIPDQNPSQPLPIQDLTSEQQSPGKDMEIEEEEIFIDSGTAGRKNEFRAERRICDENMAKMLRDSSGWIRVARNAVALKMTSTTLQITNQQYTSFPPEVSTWIAPHSGEVDQQQHIVELLDPFHKQSFHLMCYLAQDGTYTFSSSTWNEFIEDIGLTAHDILVLLDRKTSWKLSYAVFILSDDVLAAGGGGPSRDPGPVQELGGGPRSTGMMFRPMVSTPSPLLTAVPMAQPPVKLTQMMPNPGRRTLQAHVLPTAQNLTNIRIIQKVQDGRLLVQASLTSFPASRGLFIIPANSIQSWPMKFTPGGPMGYGPGSTSGSTKRLANNPPARVMSMGAAVSTGGGPTRVQGPTNFHLQTHPACLPAAPIQLNIRGGFQALAKKNDVNLYMVTDSNGQMRLITSQSGVHSANQIAPFRQTVETGRPQGFGGGIRREDRNQAPFRGTGMDSPEIMTLTSTASETSEPRMDEFGETEDKEQIMEQAKDQNGGGRMEVTSPAPGPGLESGKKEGETFEDPEESLTLMHCQMKRILEQCQGLNSDLAMRYRFAFANKMNEGQRVANFMEIKTMSEAGEWKEILEWIKSTLESL